MRSGTRGINRKEVYCSVLRSGAVTKGKGFKIPIACQPAFTIIIPQTKPVNTVAGPIR
ncbi:MAG: hypothetical protein ACLFVX_02290 [Archaeoglobaceae archaeon]